VDDAPAADAARLDEALRQAQSDLARARAENERLEAQSLQAQETEAVGRLAPGVALEFKNLLTLIVGYADRLLEQADESATRPRLEEIRSACQRAVGLAEHLLSNSRTDAADQSTISLDTILADAVAARGLGHRRRLSAMIGVPTGPSSVAERPEVLIVEDDAAVGQFIQTSLEGSGFRVAGVVRSAASAVEAIERRVPALALIDIALEGPTDGIALAELVRVRWSLPVVYVTGAGDGALFERLVRSEPHGFVSKPFNEAQLRGAVELALAAADRERKRMRELEAVRAYASELEVSASVMEARLGRIADVLRDAGVVKLHAHPGLSPEISARIGEMSRRELEVLQLLLSSRRVSSIARELSISAYTVRNHLRAVFRKLDVHSQAELLELFRGISPSAMVAATKPTERT
jgi:DNA-binding NarL/FixJ family response regulator